MDADLVQVQHLFPDADDLFFNRIARPDIG
jgi:hypothetical protein